VHNTDGRVSEPSSSEVGGCVIEDCLHEPLITGDLTVPVEILGHPHCKQKTHLFF